VQGEMKLQVRSGLRLRQYMTMIDVLLGHSSIRTTERYAHLADDPKKLAANRISGHIAEVLGVVDSANIISLHTVFVSM
jgi:hypothetical protein